MGMDDTEEQRAHWQRGEEIADQQRRSLLTLNAGAIAGMFVLTSFLADQGAASGFGWAVWPTVLFCLGIAAVHVSLYMAKWRATKRANGELDGKPPFLRSSYPWDAASLIALAAGVILALIAVPK